MATDLSWLYRKKPVDQALTLADLYAIQGRDRPGPGGGEGGGAGGGGGMIGGGGSAGGNIQRGIGPSMTTPNPNKNKSDSGGGGFGNFSIPGFSGSAGVKFGAQPAPVFNPPLFSVPDANALLTQDPGFLARMKYGEQALENSAAATGTLNTGNTLAGVTQFGQDYASNEYSNVFNRALQAYNTKYQAAKDVFTPKFTAWQQLTGIGEQNALAAFQRQFDLYQLAVTSSLAEQGLITSIALGGTSQPNFPSPGA